MENKFDVMFNVRPSSCSFNGSPEMLQMSTSSPQITS